MQQYLSCIGNFIIFSAAFLLRKKGGGYIANVTYDKIMLDVDECSLGICPCCDNESLDYRAPELVDESIFYPWKCETCGAEGAETCTVVFNGHNVERHTISPETEKRLIPKKEQQEQAAKTADKKKAKYQGYDR